MAGRAAPGACGRAVIKYPPPLAIKSSNALCLGLLSVILTLSLAMDKMTMAQEHLRLTLSPESENVYTTESIDILAVLTTLAGEPVMGQEITFSTDLGTLNPDRAVTDDRGEARVTFTAPNESGVSHITATANEISQTIEVTVISTFQWIVSVILCLLGMLGAGSAAALYWMRVRIAKRKDGEMRRDQSGLMTRRSA